jgi:hypothetical protein
MVLVRPLRSISFDEVVIDSDRAARSDLHQITINRRAAFSAVDKFVMSIHFRFLNGPIAAFDTYMITACGGDNPPVFGVSTKTPSQVSAEAASAPVASD